MSSSDTDGNVTDGSVTDARVMQGKVALVTGSSSGIGEAIALTLARRGASVTLTGRNEERLKAALDKCVQASGGFSDRFFSLAGDLKDATFRKRLVDETVTRFGKLDSLICNAGGDIAAVGIDDATEEQFDAQVDILVKSVFFLIQTAVPHLEKSKGNIVSVSSVLDSMVAPKCIVLCMCKAAIDHMTRCLALDLAPRGIRVNTLSPSFVITRLWRHLPTEEENTKAMSEFAVQESKNQPLGNRVVTVEELAEGAFFLASDASSFVTGQNLAVDGGRSLAGPVRF